MHVVSLVPTPLSEKSRLARSDVIVLSKQVMKLAVCLIVAVIPFTASVG